MAYLTEWTRLPHIASEDTPHYSGTNPEDRRMLYAAGEASLLNGWEEHPDPRAWIRKVAWNLIKRRKLEDEDEYISAFAHGIEIESRDAPKQEKVCGRLGEATSKADRRSITL